VASGYLVNPAASALSAVWDIVQTDQQVNRQLFLPRLIVTVSQGDWNWRAVSKVWLTEKNGQDLPTMGNGSLSSSTPDHKGHSVYERQIVENRPGRRCSPKHFHHLW